jgi:hypothetical protein
MPHFGHAPGFDSRTSGSIGQTYARAPAVGVSIGTAAAVAIAL